MTTRAWGDTTDKGNGRRNYYYCWSKNKAGTTVILVCRKKPVARGVKTIVERERLKQQYWLAEQRQWLEVYKHCWKRESRSGKTTIMVGSQKQWLDVHRHCWKRDSRSWENNNNDWKTKTIVGVVSTIVGRVKAAAWKITVVCWWTEKYSGWMG